MKIYLAGPMRNYPEFNHPAFHKAAAMLRAAGHEVFCPAEQDLLAGFNPAGSSGDMADLAKGGADIRQLLGADLAWICGTADALVMMPGWEKSPGARAEASTALAIGVPVRELAWFILYGEEAPTVTAVPAGTP